MSATITDNNKIVTTTRTAPGVNTVTNVPTPGPTGQSAYQVWNSAGNVGTVATFLNFLKGAKGDIGTNGTNGTNGINGAVGGPGPTGGTGPQGIQGIQGTTGSIGPAGLNGAPGASSTAATILPSTGILIPMYIYPADVFNNVTYNALIETISNNRNVPFYIILNNSSGPGAAQDGNFTYAIRRLKAVGAKVLGYVSTSYLVSKTVAQVKTDIDTWKTFYPETDGIFLDEMSNLDSATLAANYTELTVYAKTKSFFPIVANPGGPQLERYFKGGSADIIVINENTTYPTEAVLRGDANILGGNSNYDYRTRGALVYAATDATYNQTNVDLLSKYASLIYVTDGSGANPWAVVSKYLPQLIATLQGKLGIVKQVANTVTAGNSRSGVLITSASMGMHPSYTGSIRAELGYGYLRIWDNQVSPLHLSTAAGVYNWTALDNIITPAVAAGIKVLYCLGNYPAYMNDDGTTVTASTAGSNYNTKVPNSAKLVTFLTALATRYKGKITSYEVWNEWQDSSALGLTGGNQFYSGTLAQMVTISKITSDTIRAIDPAALIGSPSITGPTNFVLLDTFFTAIKTAGYDLNTLFDVITYHPYIENTEQPEAVIPLTRLYQGAMARGGCTLPLWATEWTFYSWVEGGGVLRTPLIGTSTADERYMPLHLMFEYVARGFLSLFAAGVSVAFQYGGIGSSTFSGVRLTDRDNQTGLNDAGLQLKQFFLQLKNLRTQSFAQDPVTGLNVLTLVDLNNNVQYAVWGNDNTLPAINDTLSLAVLSYTKAGFTTVYPVTSSTTQMVEIRPSFLKVNNPNLQVTGAKALLPYGKAVSTLNTTPRISLSGAAAPGWSFDSGTLVAGSGIDAPTGSLPSVWTPSSRFSSMYTDIPAAAIANMIVGKKYRIKLLHKMTVPSAYLVSLQQLTGDSPLAGSGYYDVNTATDGFNAIGWEFVLTAPPVGAVRLRIMAYSTTTQQPITLSMFTIEEIPLDSNIITAAAVNSISAANIVAGKLLLTLTSGTVLDAGNVFIQYQAIANSTRSILVGTAVQTLQGSYPAGTDAAIITVMGGTINYTIDGTSPTNIVGIPVYDGSSYEITSIADVTSFKFTTATGTPTVSVYFERRTS